MARTAFPGLPADGKSIAVMFKVGEGTGESIRRSVRVPRGVKLQFAPKGSYRLEHTVEYYEWMFEEQALAAGEEPHFVCIMDWFKPNMDPATLSCVEARGGMRLLIPGNLTGHVQVNDTRLHSPYASKYKRAETEEAMEQLRSSRALPSTTPQTVLNRAASTWHLVDHEKVSQGFVAAGIVGALDGSEDHLLGAEVAEAWQHFDMAAVRARLGVEIAGEVAAGRLTSLRQYKDVLVPYEEHRPMEEGEEAREWVANDADAEEDGGEVPARLR